jgi:predicted transcriptional regulator
MFVSSLGLSIRTISAAVVGPRSVVYSTLKELRRLGFVFTYPRDKAPSGERKKRYVCERTTWGKYGIRANSSPL